MRGLLAGAAFSRVWRAMVISSLGDWVGAIALVALVARLGGSRFGALAVAGVMLARLLSLLLFGALAGVAVDRFDRRRVMMSADLSRAILYAALPLVSNLWWIAAISFFIESSSLLWAPAKDASLPHLVPPDQLVNANSVSVIAAWGTLPVGAAIFMGFAAIAARLGGYLGNRPESLALWLDALSFLFSARMIWGLQAPLQSARPRPARSLAALRFREAVIEAHAGYRVQARHRVAKPVTIGMLMAFAGVGAVVSLAPVLARYSLHTGATGFGAIVVAFGIGMVGGMWLAASRLHLAGTARTFTSAMLGAGSCLFALAIAPTVGAAMIVAVPMGLGVGLTWVAGYTLLQTNVADEFRGRMFANLTVSSRVTLFGARVVFPLLAAAIGTRDVVVGGASLELSGTRVALCIGSVTVVAAAALARHMLRRSAGDPVRWEAGVQ